jgi:hypothetical protein
MQEKKTAAGGGGGNAVNKGRFERRAGTGEELPDSAGAGGRAGGGDTARSEPRGGAPREDTGAPCGAWGSEGHAAGEHGHGGGNPLTHHSPWDFTISGGIIARR